MEKIHQILMSNELEDSEFGNIGMDSELELLCLGTGKGATTLMTGEPSSSFVILYEGKPLLIVDLGFGVVQSFRKFVGKDMCYERIYITHNHGDHAAELPVILAVVCGKQALPVVFAAPEVMHRLRTQRLGEITSENTKLDTLVDLRTCEPGSARTPIVEGGEFSISILPSQHSETCYGFILYQNNEPVLGYTGDSGFSRSLYDQLFVAPNVVIDARTCSTYEHAGFSDVINYLQTKKHSSQVFVTGYGTECEYPAEGISGVTQLRTGEKQPMLMAPTAALPAVDGWSKPIRTNITAEYIMPVTIS